MGIFNKLFKSKEENKNINEYKNINEFANYFENKNEFKHFIRQEIGDPKLIKNSEGLRLLRLKFNQLKKVKNEKIKNEINDYKKKLNKRRNNGKITQENYNSKLEAFKKLMKIEKKINLNILLGKKFQMNPNYAKLLTFTHLENLENEIQQLPSATGNTSKPSNNPLILEKTTTNTQHLPSPTGNTRNTLNFFIKTLPSYYNKVYNNNLKKKEKKMNDFKNFVRSSIKKNNEINKLLKLGTIIKQKKIVKGMNGIDREIEENVSSLTKEQQLKIREYIARKYTERFTEYYQKLKKKNNKNSLNTIF